MPEKTKTEDNGPQAIPNYVWIMFGFLVVFVYFFGLSIPFGGPDESRYAQVGREMLERCDFITPTLGGLNWFEKPPLLYWLEVASYKVFGINEFAARFGPALFGLGCVVSLWVLGRSLTSERSEVYGQDVDHDKSFANWLALIAASTLGVLVFARGATFDIIITFPITAALVGFYIFDRARSDAIKNKMIPLILFYVFTGIALLAKGLVGLLFPYAIVALYHVLSRRLPSRAFALSLIWGTILSASIAAVWYLPMYQRHGFEFIDQFIIQQHFQRFLSNKYQHPQPFYFFFWVFPLMILPWLPFFMGGIWSGIRTMVKGENEEAIGTNSSAFPFATSSLLIFSFSWIIVPLVFFSFSGSKLPGYVLPALPGAIIVAALFAYELVHKTSKWRVAVLTIAASTFITTILLVIFVVPQYVESSSVKSLIEAARDRGFGTSRILTLHTASPNAEFYAPGRFVRSETGNQRWFTGSNEVLAEIKDEKGPVLVIVPLEYLSQLTEFSLLRTEVLKDNGEFAIVAVWAR